MIEILGLTKDDLSKILEEKGLKKFRATQIFEWIYEKRVFNFDDMTNIKLEEREKLKTMFTVMPLELVEKQRDGRTRKYLFKIDGGHLIETVLMSQEYGESICVTTQVGCNIGCGFCASGQIKKQKDLTAAEIVAQVLWVQKDIDKQDKRVSHIVVMGIGEPFDNYDNTIKALEVVNQPKGLAIGVRHITVSTSGLADRIRDFANLDKQYNLAISLHATTDEKRSKLMPINKTYNITELMNALKYYFKTTGRRITLEYIMLKGVNDTLEDAVRLSAISKGLRAHLNLIPYNPVEGNEYQKSDPNQFDMFFKQLKASGVNVTRRKEMGSKIDAACGQLRSKRLK